MVMSLTCKIFGHKLTFNALADIRHYCVRGGYQDYEMDEIIKNIVKKLEAEGL